METNGEVPEARVYRIGPEGIDWPFDGGDPFDGDLPWTGLLYWVHGNPSRVFPADREPGDDELYRAIPMGYTTLTLLERVALFRDGREVRRWEEERPWSTPDPLQPYQLLLPPAGEGKDRHLLLGASWPERFALRDASELSARTGGKILVCRALKHLNWH